MGMKLFVIVVTYKGMQWYDRCFTSLRKSTITAQTVVVDNASNDGTVEYLREHFPEIHIIESKQNLGFGRANNLGMRYALDNGCDYVFLLNQDTCVEPTSIERLVSIHNKHAEYGILSPMHLTGDMKHLNILFKDGNLRCNYELISDMYCGRMKELYEMEYVNAAAWLLPRRTLEIVGGFDPIFLHYAEDDDYLRRVRFHGLRVGLCPKVKIVHDHTNLINPFVFENQNYRREQILVLEQTDLNSPYTLNKYLFFLSRKMVLGLIKGNWNQVKQMRSDYAFLKKMMPRIKQSRFENSQSKASWL